jgi:hypothetical protein
MLRIIERSRFLLSAFQKRGEAELEGGILGGLMRLLLRGSSGRRGGLSTRVSCLLPRYFMSDSLG